MSRLRQEQIKAIQSTSAPTANDDITKGILIGHLWANTNSKLIYVCTDNSTGAAVWVDILEGGSFSIVHEDIEITSDEETAQEFTLPSTPSSSASFMLFLNGDLLRQDNYLLVGDIVQWKNTGYPLVTGQKYEYIYNISDLGSIDLAPVGTSPNVNGATLTGKILNLEPANENFSGVLTNLNQTIGGKKLFKENVQVDTDKKYLFPDLKDVTFYAAFYDQKDADYCDGSSTITLVGSASINTPYLNLAYNDNSYASIVGLKNADFQQKGALGIIIKPNYSGTPASHQYLFSLSNNIFDYKNEIDLYHSSDNGHWMLNIYDYNGNEIISGGDFGLWAPTADAEYPIELNVNVTDGTTKLFINGVQHGSALTGTGTRDSNIGKFLIGQRVCDPVYTSNFKVRKLFVYNDYQHLAPYTPSVTYPKLTAIRESDSYINKAILNSKSNYITHPNFTNDTDIIDLKHFNDHAGFVSAPALPSSDGIKGQSSYNSGYLYKCVDTNTWVRNAVETIWS